MAKFSHDFNYMEVRDFVDMWRLEEQHWAVALFSSLRFSQLARSRELVELTAVKQKQNVGFASSSSAGLQWEF